MEWIKCNDPGKRFCDKCRACAGCLSCKHRIMYYRGEEFRCENCLLEK